jgi:hypothetical protein
MTEGTAHRGAFTVQATCRRPGIHPPHTPTTLDGSVPSDNGKEQNMAEIERRLPEQFYPYEAVDLNFNVNELAADQAGSLSPFGPDVEFPVPPDRLRYTHPDQDSRPHLANGR